MQSRRGRERRWRRSELLVGAERRTAAGASEHRRALSGFSSLGQLNCELPCCVRGRLYILSASVSAPIRPPHAVRETVTTTETRLLAALPEKARHAAGHYRHRRRAGIAGQGRADGHSGGKAIAAGGFGAESIEGAGWPSQSSTRTRLC